MLYYWRLSGCVGGLGLVEAGIGLGLLLRVLLRVLLRILPGIVGGSGFSCGSVDVNHRMRVVARALDKVDNQQDPKHQAEDSGNGQACDASDEHARRAILIVTVAVIIAVGFIGGQTTAEQAAAEGAEHHPEDEEAHGPPDAHGLFAGRGVDRHGHRLDLDAGGMRSHGGCRRWSARSKDGGAKELFEAGRQNQWSGGGVPAAFNEIWGPFSGEIDEATRRELNWRQRWLGHLGGKPGWK
jgi:hypothetical protein